MDHFCDKLPTLRSDFQAQAHVVSTHPQNDLLAGRSVVLKDNIALAGLRCTNGTDLDLWIPDFDATVAKRILDAGGTIVGKAGKRYRISEFPFPLPLTHCRPISACENACFSTISDTSVTGPVRNPYNPYYNSGGSSSGSARLVAGGVVDMAIVSEEILSGREKKKRLRSHHWYSSRAAIKEDQSEFLLHTAGFSALSRLSGWFLTREF